MQYVDIYYRASEEARRIEAPSLLWGGRGLANSAVAALFQNREAKPDILVVSQNNLKNGTVTHHFGIPLVPRTRVICICKKSARLKTGLNTRRFECLMDSLLFPSQPTNGHVFSGGA